MASRFSLSCVTRKIHEAIPIRSLTTEESRKKYLNEYKESIDQPDVFWKKQAHDYISWNKPFSKTFEGAFAQGETKWFVDGELNACYNAIDRHVAERGDEVAMIWEGDEVGDTKKYTFAEMQKKISQIANAMLSKGVKKGDVVTIFMPMIPELPMTMLACARIGAVHSVVFAGFSSDALRDRLNDCNSKWVFVADEGKRGGKNVKLKESLDVALKECPQVQNVFVYKRTGTPVAMHEPRDVYMEDLLPTLSDSCPVVPVTSDHPLFILYTSGSTGKPKGILHNTAGYLLYAAFTAKNTFDMQKGDTFCCAADCGWITGHSYIVYGPLVNGVTTVMFESIPTYPDPYRYWDLVERVGATQFYTAPTAIRALMKFDSAGIKKYNLSTLRNLGSVGEPINPEAWEWYFNNVGQGKCTVSDTYWQTETGGHIATNLPGTTPMKPGSCSNPYYGIDLVVLDPQSGKEIQGNNVEGVLAIKRAWPGMAASVYGDHERFLNTYLKPYPGYYFTGDSCRRDEDGNYFITGRVDDVINPSGHRIGTAELEAALNSAEEVSESAVIGFPHDVKGEGIGCFVILKEGYQPSDKLAQSLKNSVRKAIGPIATPDFIVFTDLPKTRSGKIMRRILRKIAAGEEHALGDTSTLADPSVVPKLIEQFKAMRSQPRA